MSARPTTLVALSATHHTAGLDARAAFSVSPAGVETFYQAARAAGLAEVVLLATCNRLEAYAIGDEAAALHARAALMQATGVTPEALDRHLRPIPGLQAVEHLFAVVSGLDSQMIGEAEIAGQAKDAYADALARGMTGPILNRIFQRAFQAGAWARTNTGISQGHVSLGNVAVELASRVFGQLAEARVLVLGTGEVGRQVVQALVSRGATQVSVASRTFENARALAEEFAGSSLTLADALQQAHAHDVIVGCASVERALLDAETIRGFTGRRQGRPLLLVDLGVPRNFDAASRHVEGAYLCDLDDLSSVANANLQARLAEVARARTALTEKAARVWGAAQRPESGTP
ncbi:MAG: glutamyl-tRNA reductase [Verrucomicrobia bacterium]|jgi:glutamyl-tRNA reductase|nr:glutamyl-tRNA reductase [Verrucomicrobiota bacterium]